jgi:hypothetical protein
MISILGIQDAENFAKAEWPKVNVYIDGEKVDTLSTKEPIREGMELESEAISRALEGRRVVNMAFSGNMVTVFTEPE